MPIVQLASANWHEMVGGAGLVMVNFWADGSEPCARFRPVFERASERHIDIVFAEVDVGSERRLAARLGVLNVPTVMVMAEGARLCARTGLLSEQVLEGLIGEARASRLQAAPEVAAVGPGPGVPAGPGPEPARSVPEGRVEPVHALAALGLVADDEEEAAASLDRGLVASYPMNEGSGSDVVDEANGHMLGLYGPRWGAGFAGPGLEFTCCAVALAPGFLDTQKSFTLSALVRLADSSGWCTVLSQDGSQVSGFYLQYSVADQAWAFSMMSEDSVKAPSAMAVATSPPLIGGWQHLVGVHDTVAGELRLYVDGRRAATAGCFRPGWRARGPFVVGRGFFGAPADWFTGNIDQVRVWNRALSDDDVSAIAAC
jgi:thiol-disulfide isomerase/thioredoxin